MINVSGEMQGQVMLHTPSWFQVQGFRVRYARFRPDQRLQPPAMHGRLCVFLAGSMKETLVSGEHFFGENDVLYKPPEEKPRFCFGPKGAGTLTVEFDAAPGRLLGAVGFPANRPFALRSPHCAAIARRMLREMTSPDALTLIALEGLTFQLFVEIKRRTSPWFKLLLSLDFVTKAISAAFSGMLPDLPRGNFAGCFGGLSFVQNPFVHPRPHQPQRVYMIS